MVPLFVMSVPSSDTTLSRSGPYARARAEASSSQMTVSLGGVWKGEGVGRQVRKAADYDWGLQG